MFSNRTAYFAYFTLALVLIAGDVRPQTWQINHGNASLDIDGRTNDPFSPLEVTRCVNEPMVATLASINVGSPWELAISFNPGVALGAGGLWVSPDQIVNLDVSQPLVFLNGLSWSALIASPVQAIPFVSLVPIPVLTSQAIVLDQASPGGVVFSACNQLHVVSDPGSGESSYVRGPKEDDSVTVIEVTSCPLNLPPITFFGTSYSELYVSANGRVLFGGGDNDWSPSVNEAVANRPFVGVWADFDPGESGAISVHSPRPGALRVNYRHLPYHGQPTTASTFGITFDTLTDAIAISGLSGLDAGAASTVAFLGLSAGNLGASDPGPTTFVAGGPNAGPPGLGMIYALGSPSTVAPNLRSVTFVPNGAGNYDWTASSSDNAPEFHFSGVELVEHIEATLSFLNLTPPTRAALMAPLNASKGAIQAGSGAQAIADLNQFMALVMAHQVEINGSFPFPTPPPGQSLPFNSTSAWILQMPGYVVGLGPAQIVQPVAATMSSSRLGCVEECWDAFVDCMGNPSYSWWSLLTCGFECLPSLLASPLGFALCYIACNALSYTDDCLFNFVLCLTNC